MSVLGQVFQLGYKSAGIEHSSTVSMALVLFRLFAGLPCQLFVQCCALLCIIDQEAGLAPEPGRP